MPHVPQSSDKNKLKELKVDLRRRYSNPDDNHSFCVIRLNSFAVSRLGKRNAWVSLTSGKGKTVYRTIQGRPKICGKEEWPFNAMELDYETERELGIDTYLGSSGAWYRCPTIVVKPVHPWNKWRAHWNHPKEAYRVPIQLSIIGLVLGLIGLALGILSFF